MRTRFELADVVHRFAPSLRDRGKLTPLQQRVFAKIALCRTATLGGHEEACDNCGTIRYSYNSCGDRHCPKCQAARQAFWIDGLVQGTLPVKHYHVVFTVPDHLNVLCLHNGRMFYNLLFSAVWHTLNSFGYSHYGVETGAIAVLHTWGQNLSLHPHIHCLVPAAGYSLDGRWKNIGHGGKFLYPVRQMSSAFKSKFLDSLKRALREQNQLILFNDQIQRAYGTPWVVHCQPSMASAEHVVRYLGQYTHRVTITNQRIVNVTDEKVTFIAKDYRQGAAKKYITLGGAEFLRRFAQHILPRRFVKIRCYGIYNHTAKRNPGIKFRVEDESESDNKSKSRKTIESNIERFERLTGINPCHCPVCKTGQMIRIRKLPPIRSPPGATFIQTDPQL